MWQMILSGGCMAQRGLPADSWPNPCPPAAKAWRPPGLASQSAVTCPESISFPCSSPPVEAPQWYGPQASAPGG